MAEPQTNDRTSSVFARIAHSYQQLVAPRASGLPNLLVLTVPPIAAVVVFAVLVALGISGSSTGVFNSFFDA